jgi:hypothetical protein
LPGVCGVLRPDPVLSLGVAADQTDGGAARPRRAGTASNYFKSFVDVKGDYTDKGYVAPASTAGLPFLVATIVGMLVVVGVVVSRT